MADAAKPKPINRVQHSALYGAAAIIAFYNETINGTVRAIAGHFGIAPEDGMGDYYGHLSDELTASGVNQTPGQTVRNIMTAYNLEVVDEP